MSNPPDAPDTGTGTPLPDWADWIPDAELKKALDALRDRTLESKSQPNTSGAKAAYIVARKGVELLFERLQNRIAERVEYVGELHERIALLEEENWKRLAIIEAQSAELSSLRSTALTREEADHIAATLAGQYDESLRPELFAKLRSLSSLRSSSLRSSSLGEQK